jgi:hypothetical protein
VNEKESNEPRLLTKDIFQPKDKSARRPKGYRESEDGQTWEPIPEICEFLAEALNQLNAGIAVRKVADWYNSNVPDSEKLSHQGLRVIRVAVNPDYTPRVPGNAIHVKRVPRERRKELTRIAKIANDKRRIIAATKRIGKKEAELATLRKQEYERREIQSAAVISRGPEHFEAITEKATEAERDIAFKPNTGPQSDFLASSEQEVLYGGAAGGGKSYAMIADPLRYVHNKNFNGLLLRRTNDELREIIWNSQDVYKRAFGKTVTWSEKKSLWTWDSGARLWMTYLERDEDVMRYHGQAFTWIGVDELTQYSTPFSWNYLRTRLRTSDPTLPLVMRATTNPGGPGHGWVKRMFIDPAPWNTPFWATNIDTGEVLSYPKDHEKAGQPLFQRRFIPAKLSDNPYLYKDGLYEANLLSQSDGLRRQLLEGDWSVAEGAAFPEFRYSIHTCKPFPIPDNWRVSGQQTTVTPPIQQYTGMRSTPMEHYTSIVNSIPLRKPEQI